MAINTLATATLFMTQLDKIAVQEATTGWMDANAGQVIYNGGSEVKIPKMSVQGMGDYDREAGYQRGSVTLEYETRKMTQDRGRLFQLDPMDINEAMSPWEHGIDYQDVQKLYDAWIDEGNSQLELYQKILIPLMVVSGFLPEKTAASLLEEIENA